MIVDADDPAAAMVKAHAALRAAIRLSIAEVTDAHLVVAPGADGFSSFGRGDARTRGITADDARLLEGEPQSFRVLVPVTIEECAEQGGASAWQTRRP